jgi:cytohesin
LQVLAAVLLLSYPALCADIFEAAKEGNLAAVEALLKKNPGLASKKHAHGLTPLFVAAANGHKDVVELLLASGADANARDSNGATPLQSAALSGHADVVGLLLAKGAVADAKTKDGTTPLCNAAEKGHKDVVELLLSKGADANAKDNNDFTPLHCAVDSGHADVVGLLLARGADPNHRARTCWTPLHYAALSGHADVVGLLLASGADPNLGDCHGFTPLVQAKGRDIEELLEAAMLPEAALLPGVTAAGWIESQPVVRAVGWIESQSVAVMTYDDTGAGKSSGWKKYYVLRCADGHDYFLLSADPYMALNAYFTFNPTRNYVITGNVAPVWPNFLPLGTNGFETMTNPVTGKNEHRDVSHVIFVR